MATTIGIGGAQSESEPHNVRREASKECPGSKSHLPIWVSDWKRGHVEQVLHIYYEKNCSETLQEILDKIPKIQKKSSKLEEAIAILKKPKFIPHLDNLLLDHRTKKHLSESLKEVDSNFPPVDASSSSSSSLSRWQRAHILSSIHQYVFAIENLVNTVIKKKQSKERSSSVCEDLYTKLVSAFATMCGLKAIEGNKDNQSVWNHLMGMNKAVISKPDLRFHCTGDDFTSDNNLLTVIEVKNKGGYTEMEKLKRKHEDNINRKVKRRRYTVCYSSSSSSSVQQSDEILSPETESPSIEYEVGRHTLGQHAGELLLDLHAYMQQHKGEHGKPSILTMPGMIVDQTLVYLTLLEISYQHYEKLTRAAELTSEDRATIYYSLGYNMFNQESIPFLVDTFVKLNSIESIIKYEEDLTPGKNA